MALTDHVDDLATSVATELKKTRVLVNNNAVDLAALDTTAKGNLVAAINEVNTLAESAAGGGVAIDDGAIADDTTWSSLKIDDEIGVQITAAAPDLTDLINDTTASTTTVYSSTKTDAQIAAAKSETKSELIGSAGTLYDTLGEIQGLLEDNDGDISGLLTAIDLKAPINAPTFTGVPSAPTATGGTNTTQIATTAFVTSAVAGATIADASATVKGKVELATDAEAIAGTDTVRAVTPANLMAVVGNTATADFVATFNAGLV